MTFATSDDLDAGLMCRIPGCRNRWTVDILHGRVCSHHDTELSRGGVAPPAEVRQRHQAPIPLRDAVRPYAEPAEHDEEAF